MNVVIFGGAGFIGLHFTNYLLEKNLAKHIFLADIKKREPSLHFKINPTLWQERVTVPDTIDVRRCIEKKHFPEKIDLIINLAAIHREPGHKHNEYFETNILGAQNVTAFAEEVDCTQIIFTSSISPYGRSDFGKDENSLTEPLTAYGSSKLVAEKVHLIWQAKEQQIRKLIIVRPGVVFGPGEGGNVSRMIKAIIKGYFFYTGNKKTIKAGGYIKELCNTIAWAQNKQISDNENVILYNFSTYPIPSMQDFTETVQRVAGINRKIFSVPHVLLWSIAYILEVLLKPLKISHPFSPVRLDKLIRPNNIKPSFLLEKGYVPLYTLQSAMEDWKQECEKEWQA